MPGVIVVGAQWGDEGKGKIIDFLTASAKHSVRSQGGNNAGHTVVIGNEEYRLYLTPSGILHPHTQCHIGAGTTIDPEILVLELNALQSRGIEIAGRLWISPAAHIIFPYHRLLDKHLEMKKGLKAVGTTGRGIGPCNADKANRLGIRMCELVNPEIFPKILQNILNIKNDELVKLYRADPVDYEELLVQYTSYAEYLNPHIRDVSSKIEKALKEGENVLFEGTQGTFLDSTLGTYPYVTSSNTVAGSICVGAGIGPNRIDHTLGVVKAYTTKLGLGPFPTEVKDGFIDHYTAREQVIARKRRLGWFDAVLVKNAVRFNGLNSIAVTKLDVLDKLDTISICVAYEINGEIIKYIPHLSQDLENAKPIYETLPGWKSVTSDITTFDKLPAAAKNYLKRIEEITEVPISMISVGPERNQTIIVDKIFR